MVQCCEARKAGLSQMVASYPMKQGYTLRNCSDWIEDSKEQIGWCYDEAGYG